MTPLRWLMAASVPLKARCFYTGPRLSTEAEITSPALASYETLYAKDESNEACKTGLSLCLLETGDYDRAKSLGVILGQVYSRIARDQINAGQYDEALSTIDTGLAEAGADDVGREELTFNQAVAWEYKGDYKKALKILESYDQKYTAEGNAARELAFLKTRQGNH